MPHEVGSIIEGKVTGITKFGAFVELDDGAVGMVHISEISQSYVNDISEHLKEKPDRQGEGFKCGRRRKDQPFDQACASSTGRFSAGQQSLRQYRRPHAAERQAKREFPFRQHRRQEI